jgi:myo-inositol-1(or 4)-monophosphatase
MLKNEGRRVRALRRPADAAKAQGEQVSPLGHPLNVEADRSAVAARDCLAAAAREAGTLSLGFFRPGAATLAEVKAKVGGSPVTEADLAADALLKRRLGAAFPQAGWLSEETADDAGRLTRRALLIVDPIDGTRAFVAGDARWAVSLALVVDGRPVAAVVHAPALGETYEAARGAGAALNGAPIAAARPSDGRRFSAAGPKHILQAMAARLGASVEIVPRVPSLAYRLCLAARGAIDLAAAAADSHDWDIAAADLLIDEAGGRLTDASGGRLMYNRKQIRRGPLFAAREPLAPGLLGAFRAATGARGEE